MTHKKSPSGPQPRLLAAGKTLFAQLGYEQTSTSAIARQAGTSESQLVRYFDGKRGLLAAILDEGWAPLTYQIENAVTQMNDPVEALKAILASIIAAFQRDPELAYLFLFEGRRIRAAGREPKMSRGYISLVQLLQQLIRRAQKVRAIAADIDAAALCSALVGAAEAMIRDRLIATHSGGRRAFSQQQIHRVFAALLEGIRQRRRPSTVLRNRTHRKHSAHRD